MLPPLLIDLYRDVRYGRSHPQPAIPENGIKPEVKDVQFALPERALSELFPGIESLLVTTPVSELYRPRDMVVPLPELLTLAGICRRIKPRRIFEIGTYTGSSTLVMAANTSDETEILTLDLKPTEKIGSAFRDTAYSSKIRQLYGNSLTFDYQPYERSVDLVLVDANHSYESVKSDTENAFALLRSGGVIVWDDYRWLEIHSECAGVTLFLNELQATRSLFNIAGTRFAIYLDN
ncbi:MAG TPA: class I SAM-dependent methyltransferase [Pyrinomonadaceae bacterium]